MRIIKYGYEKEVTCPKCNTRLAYDSSDIHIVGDMEGDYFPSVKCPDCNHWISLNWLNLSKVV